MVLSESNLFTWPGPDLRRVSDGDNATVAYGFLPPKLFRELKRHFLAAHPAAHSIPRTE